jgi:hypothetical protein
MKLHSALPKEGLFSVEDSTGKRRWVNIGHKVDGMTVEGYNSQSNTLILADGGKLKSVGLQGGTVFDSTVPDRQTAVGKGTMSEADQSLANTMGMTGAMSDDDQKELDAAKGALNQPDYNVDPKWVEQTRKNFMQGEYFKANPQIKGVHTLEEYKALEATGGLNDGIHMVMKNEADGIGLDHFYHGNPANDKTPPLNMGNRSDPRQGPQGLKFGADPSTQLPVEMPKTYR